MTSMNESQVAAVAANVKATAVVAKDLVLANIVDALYAVNASSAAGFDNAFIVSGITPDAAYTALVADAKSAVRTDMVENRSSGYADVAAADAFFMKLVTFRTAVAAAVNGANGPAQGKITAADFAAGGRLVAEGTLQELREREGRGDSCLEELFLSIVEQDTAAA
jgi:hypothetical protein